jgi:hypothetical protein
MIFCLEYAVNYLFSKFPVIRKLPNVLAYFSIGHKTFYCSRLFIYTFISLPLTGRAAVSAEALPHRLHSLPQHLLHLRRRRRRGEGEGAGSYVKE